MTSRRQGFTLIEVLVVIAIIAILAALILGLMGSISVRGQIASTQTLLDTVAGGITRFKDETGHYPMPNGSAAEPFLHPPEAEAHRFPEAYERFSWYPASDVNGWERQALGWRLTRAMDGERQKLAKADVQASWQRVDYIAGDSSFQRLWTMTNAGIGAANVSTLRPELDARVTDAEAEELRTSSCSNSDWTSGGQSIASDGSMKYRGWAKLEIARLRGLRARSFFSRSWNSAAVLELADLPESCRRDDGIIDVWGQALGYIHHHEPGYEGRRFRYSAVLKVKERHLPSHQRLALDDRNHDGAIDEQDYDVEPAEAVDCNKDGTIDADDWASHLWYALPGYETGFLLFSAGPDRQTHRRYRDPLNDDDIRYRGGMQ